MPETRTNISRAKRGKARRTIRMASTVTPTRKGTLSGREKSALITGVVVATAAAAGAVIVRRRIGRLALAAAAEAVSTGHSVGSFGHRVGKSVGRELSHIDLKHLLTLAGFKKRPSLFSRLVAPVGALAAHAIIAGLALFLIAPKLRAADKDAPKRENEAGAAPGPRPASVGASKSIHNSTGNPNGEVGEGASYAVT
jgi:hypothetical protein